MLSLRELFRVGLLAACSASWARAEVKCVRSEKANVREGAGIDHPVAWVADRFTPFEALDWDGEWVGVNGIDGNTGWMHQSVLSSDPCVIMAGKLANIRSGPGLEHEALWEVEHGYPFKVLQRQEDWIQVTDGDEVEGWIFVKLVWGAAQPEESGGY